MLTTNKTSIKIKDQRGQSLACMESLLGRRGRENQSTSSSDDQLEQDEQTSLDENIEEALDDGQIDSLIMASYRKRPVETQSLASENAIVASTYKESAQKEPVLATTGTDNKEEIEENLDELTVTGAEKEAEKSWADSYITQPTTSSLAKPVPTPVAIRGDEKNDDEDCAESPSSPASSSDNHGSPASDGDSSNEPPNNWVEEYEMALSEKVQKMNGTLKLLKTRSSYPFMQETLQDVLYNSEEDISPADCDAIDGSSDAKQRAFAASILSKQQVTAIIRTHEMLNLVPEKLKWSRQAVIDTFNRYCARYQWHAGGYELDDDEWDAHLPGETVAKCKKPVVSGEIFFSNTVDSDYVNDSELDLYLDNLATLMDKTIIGMNCTYQYVEMKRKSKVRHNVVVVCRKTKSESTGGDKRKSSSSRSSASSIVEEVVREI
jgi:hypothetical protein